MPRVQHAPRALGRVVEGKNITLPASLSGTDAKSSPTCEDCSLEHNFDRGRLFSKTGATATGLVEVLVLVHPPVADERGTIESRLTARGSVDNSHDSQPRVRWKCADDWKGAGFFSARRSRKLELVAGRAYRNV